MKQIEIRESAPSDWSLIEALYPDAFPEEDLLPLVRELLQEASAALSLVGLVGSALVGHIILTRCRVTGCNKPVALLGPLAVSPAWQRRGVGSALVHAGLKQLEHDGVASVYVLGDPSYYARFGFAREAGVVPPYTLPAEWRTAWQSMSLSAGGSHCQGTLSTPRPWLRPALWSP